MMQALHHSSMGGLQAESGAGPHRRLYATVEAFVKFFSFGSLRIRIIMLVLIAVVPLASLLFYAASEQKRQSVAAIEQKVLAMAEFAAQAEALMLDGSREMLAGLALTLRDRWTAPAECNAYLANLLERDRHYQNFGAVTGDGRLVCSAVPLGHEFDAREQSWFRQAVSAREFSIGEIRLLDRTAIPPEVLAFPVDDDGGRFIGVVFAVLEPHWFQRFNLKLERSLPNGSTVAQIDADGAVLAHHPDSMAWGAWPADWGALIDALRSMSKGMVMLTDSDGQRWLYAFSELSSNVRTRKVHIVMAVPQAVVFEKANRLLAHNLTLLTGSTGLILMAAWFGNDLLVLRQVRALLAATRKLTGGDLSARTEIAPGPGELNELAGAFDDMARALETREGLRQRAERELKDSREELRSLASHLESIREEERTRLAREIHDELGQAMTALKMDTVWLNRRLNPDQDRLHAKTRSMEGLIDATIQTVQRLSGELRPGLLDDLGLAAAIEWQAEEFQRRTGIFCAVAMDLQDMALSRDHVTALFRIFQETLTNVIRHAQATAVEVRLRTVGARLILEIADNGRGIATNELKNSKAYGLIGMRERALAIRGEFTIKGPPGLGTTVTVSLPLEKIG